MKKVWLRRNGIKWHSKLCPKIRFSIPMHMVKFATFALIHEYVFIFFFFSIFSFFCVTLSTLPPSHQSFFCPYRYFKHSKWPFMAARLQTISLHSQPFSCAYIALCQNICWRYYQNNYRYKQNWKISEIT
jgi:hypothetical protein